jgi:hypothetical protein
MDNFNSQGWTAHKNSEVIQKKITLNYKGKNETVLQLGMQNNYGLNSVYSETWGLSRNRKEKFLNYIKRVYNDPIVRDSNCIAMREIQPFNIAKMNELIKTNENTYYFCMSTGERKRLREKQREILTEPKKMLTNSIGFDLNVS